MELGILVQPIVDLANAKTPAPISQYRIACAKVDAGYTPWCGSVRKLASYATDIVMDREYGNIVRTVSSFLAEVNTRITEEAKSNDTARLQTACRELISNMKDDFYERLSAIPVEWEPEIFAANTPFTSYLKIKDAISTARTRIHYFDRYLRAEFFELFLRDTDRSIELSLVTTNGNREYGVTAMRAVSDLARQEFRDYQLIQVDPGDLHDRNLVVYAAVFSLGPGVDRAGFALTNFSPSDNSAEAHAQLERIIKSGTIIHQS